MSEDERIALYTRLFVGHRSALRAFLMKQYRGDIGGEIEDVLQDTWLQGRNTFPPRSASFNTWITTCAISAVHMRLRKRARHVRNVNALSIQPDPAAHLMGGSTRPDLEAERKERADETARFLDALSEGVREMVVLFLMGFSHREIADLLGRNFNTVKTAIHRAKHGFLEARQELAA